MNGNPFLTGAKNWINTKIKYHIMLSSLLSIWVNGIMLKSTSQMWIQITKSTIYGKLCSVSMIKNTKKSKSTLEETGNSFIPKFVNSLTFPMKEKCRVSLDSKH